jgi:hypothetical protein
LEIRIANLLNIRGIMKSQRIKPAFFVPSTRFIARANGREGQGLKPQNEPAPMPVAPAGD